MTKEKEYIVTFKVLASKQAKVMEALDNLLSHGGQPDSIRLFVETFGHVSWSDDDIKTALRQEHKRVTQDNIDKVKDSYEARHIADIMIERGWESLHSAVQDIG